MSCSADALNCRQTPKQDHLMPVGQWEGGEGWRAWKVGWERIIAPPPPK